MKLQEEKEVRALLAKMFDETRPPKGPAVGVRVSLLTPFRSSDASPLDASHEEKAFAFYVDQTMTLDGEIFQDPRVIFEDEVDLMLPVFHMYHGVKGIMPVISI